MHLNFTPMKKFQTFLLFGVLLVAPLLAGVQQANADTSVVMLISVDPGNPTDEAVAGMKVIIKYIGKQKNLISQEFLQSKFKDNKPAFIHIMRWKNLSDWEVLSEDQKFLDLMAKESTLFSFKPAEVFTPVK
jgi:hypothetical protein